MSLKSGKTNYIRPPYLERDSSTAVAFALFKNRLVDTPGRQHHKALLVAAVSNTSKKGVDGVLVAPMNSVDGHSNGFVAGMFNKIGFSLEGGFSGVMVGALNKIGGLSGNAKGVLLGAVNHIGGSMSGIVVSPTYNYVGMTVDGITASVVNECEKFRGVMIGAVNIAKQGSRGVQIGIVNIREYAPWYAKVIPGIAVRWSDKRAQLAEPKTNPDYY